MSNKVNGLYVTLDKSYRDDDVEIIINAIKMIKCVINVEVNIESHEDYFAQQKIKFEIRQKLIDFIQGELK